MPNSNRFPTIAAAAAVAAAAIVLAIPSRFPAFHILYSSFLKKKACGDLFSFYLYIIQYYCGTIHINDHDNDHHDHDHVEKLLFDS